MCFLRPSLGIRTPASSADEQLMGMLGTRALPQALGPPSQARGGSWGAAQAPAGTARLLASPKPEGLRGAFPEQPRGAGSAWLPGEASLRAVRLSGS